MPAKVAALEAATSEEPITVTKISDFNASTPRGSEDPDGRVRVEAFSRPTTADAKLQGDDDVPYSSLEPDDAVINPSEGDFHHAIIIFCIDFCIKICSFMLNEKFGNLQTTKPIDK